MDTITSSKELKVVGDFYDSDNRTITLENPKDNLKASDINAVAEWAKANNPIIGDKAGAAFVGMSSAKIIEKTTVKLDI